MALDIDFGERILFNMTKSIYFRQAPELYPEGLMCGTGIELNMKNADPVYNKDGTVKLARASWLLNPLLVKDSVVFDVRAGVVSFIPSYGVFVTVQARKAPVFPLYYEAALVETPGSREVKLRFVSKPTNHPDDLSPGYLVVNRYLDPDSEGILCGMFLGNRPTRTATEVDVQRFPGYFETLDPDNVALVMNNSLDLELNLVKAKAGALKKNAKPRYTLSIERF